MNFHDFSKGECIHAHSRTFVSCANIITIWKFITYMLTKLLSIVYESQEEEKKQTETFATKLKVFQLICWGFTNIYGSKVQLLNF